VTQVHVRACAGCLEEGEFIDFEAELIMTISDTTLRSAEADQAHKSQQTGVPHEAELFIFIRFHACEGAREMLASELRTATNRVRTEPGCQSIEAYGAVADSRLFWLHAVWTDERAFNRHAELLETTQFINSVQRFIDHPFELTRTRLLR
jgi:quinol monooxygenase YgiN